MLIRFLNKFSIRVMTVVAAFAITSIISTSAYADDFQIDSARWDEERNQLQVRGEGDRREDVTVTNADTGAFIGEDDVSRRGNWRVRVDNPSSVPCRVRAEQTDGETDEKC